jgi:hypothetical protein
VPKPPVEGGGEGAARFYTIVSKLNLESDKQDAVVKWGTEVRGLTYDWRGHLGRSNASAGLLLLLILIGGVVDC